MPHTNMAFAAQTREGADPMFFAGFSQALCLYYIGAIYLRGLQDVMKGEHSRDLKFVICVIILLR